VPYSLAKRLEEEGFQLRRTGVTFQDYDAVVVSDGEGTARVYLPTSGTDRWQGRHTFDQLKRYVRHRDGAVVNMLETIFFVKGRTEHLSVNPAVDLGVMLGRDDPGAGMREYVVYTAKRSASAPPMRGAFAIIRRKVENGRTLYRYVYRRGLDPFDYETTVPAVRNAPVAGSDGWHQTVYHDEREWLAMTIDTMYPDAPFAIDNYFSGRDQADVVLSASPGYNFDETAVDRSDHGYLLAPSMRCTWIMAGRGVRQGAVSIRPHRIVDMLPTALKALGAADVLGRVTLDGLVADEALEEGSVR
jgi:hypothetical protein